MVAPARCRSWPAPKRPARRCRRRLEATMTTWGLIGLGKIADKRGGAAFAACPAERLVAVAGRDAERTAAFAARHGAAPRTMAELLADPTIEAVYVAASNDLHAEYTLAAAAAGK